MSDRYGLVHYPGDATTDLHEGQLLGTDEIGRPYAVLDAEFTPKHTHAEGHFDGDGCTFPTEGHFLPVRTTVHLQYATPEQITAAIAKRQATMDSHARFAALFRPEQPS